MIYFLIINKKNIAVCSVIDVLTVTGRHGNVQKWVKINATSAHTRSYIQYKREDLTYFIFDISFKIIFNYLDIYQGLITKQNKLYKI